MEGILHRSLPAVHLRGVTRHLLQTLCDTVDSACNGAVAEEECHVHRGHLQVHRDQGYFLDVELAQESVTVFKNMSLDSFEGLLIALTQPPASVAISTDSVFSSGVVALSCNSGAARTSTTQLLPAVDVYVITPPTPAISPFSFILTQFPTSLC